MVRQSGDTKALSPQEGFEVDNSQGVGPTDTRFSLVPGSLFCWLSYDRADWRGIHGLAFSVRVQRTEPFAFSDGVGFCRGPLVQVQRLRSEPGGDTALLAISQCVGLCGTQSTWRVVGFGASNLPAFASCNRID